MIRILIESPYAGDVRENVVYAKRAVLDCKKRNEAAYASHLFYTQDGLLDDTNPEERKFGIEAGLLWGECAHLVAFYIDRGWSNGMKAAFHIAKARGTKMVLRHLDKEIAEIDITDSEELPYETSYGI